jgi:hypothetical protein
MFTKIYFLMKTKNDYLLIFIFREKMKKEIDLYL